LEERIERGDGSKGVARLIKNPERDVERFDVMVQADVPIGVRRRYALQTFDFLRAWPRGELGVFSLGPDTTWEAVEAAAKLGFIPREDWRAILRRGTKSAP
jgi:hypothetical protein